MVPADPDKTPKVQRLERRHDQRKKLAVEAELHTAGSAAPLRVKTADLSTIGCYVDDVYACGSVFRYTTGPNRVHSSLSRAFVPASSWALVPASSNCRICVKK